MNARILLMVFFLLIFTKQEIFSQGSLSHELGVIAGPLALYSDYGERNDTQTNFGNMGLSIGLVHYINFYFKDLRYSYFKNHFMIRNEIDFYKMNLQHYGEWVDPAKTSLTADQLRAMSGSTTVFEIGTNLEYYLFNLRDFASGGPKLAPYIGVGANWVSFYPEVKSTIGPLNSNASTPIKYRNSFQNEKGSTWAAAASVGMRYKLTQMSDLLLDARWHYYFSDYIDGLNPSEENNRSVPVPENKSNDWRFGLNVGYIFYLDN
jgi:hypothetical protein